jgi:hypothetical protein
MGLIIVACIVATLIWVIKIMWKMDKEDRDFLRDPNRHKTHKLW